MLPGGQFVVAWNQTQVAWGITLGPPAMFMTLEGEDDCGFGSKPCTRAPWHWDGKALVRTP